MKRVYQNIKESIQNGEKLLAILIDPDKMDSKDVHRYISQINSSIATHIFVGGSSVEDGQTHDLIGEIKKQITLPIILFPGDIGQITEKADALLFLSLISGRNPDYLIEKQVTSVTKLRNSQLEVIPTGYILIENGRETSVQKVTRTLPMSRENIQLIVDTAKAGELLGMQLIYLEAGSGASHPITEEIVMSVKQDLDIPLIVGGGIKSKQQLTETFEAGADIVVIGTAFEDDPSFFEKLT